MDLCTLDPEGEPWDFSKPGQRKRAIELIKQRKPTLIVGSPMCAMFSALQALNTKKMDPLVFQKAYQVQLFGVFERLILCKR